MSKSPVFIVGSPRSGTSALVDAMLGAGYHGYREGNFLTLLMAVNRVIDRHFAVFGAAGPQVLASLIDQDKFKASIAQLFRDEANGLNPVEPWFDKSGNPEMIEAIPILLQLWPTAHFIFAKRRAIENIVSRMRKFPKLNFEYHCRDWTKNMQAWRQTRARIPQGQGIEVDQQDLIRKPEEAAARISQLLDLDDQQKTALVETFRRGRPQQTEEGTAQRVLALSDVWPDHGQRSQFEAICEAEMSAFGYATDDKYWA